ncbi:Transcriptional activator protein acu-15 [Rhizoctonia solani]|uniref:Transcriptional activator protein acu-15 n=1 Tax=Rhizoctonia solani TaxID=456999 RepID=A0A0K6GHI0_9AGAM|nr:Transcriptional activator protein acu-15 [Rhizoctonia solani]
MASFPSLPFPTISGPRAGPSVGGSTSGASTISSSPSTTTNTTVTPSARPPSPSTPSVSGSSIFDTRRTYVAEDTDTVSLRTTITDDDRSGSPAPSLNMPRSGVPARGKRKRLSKACDSCHKSKRRCDGTSPCANCDFAGKPCVYTDANGRIVPPPRSREHEEEHHPTNRPRRHSVSVAHILTHGQNHPEDRNGPPFAASPSSPMPQLDLHLRPPIPIPGQHHLVPPQPPRPFDTPLPPASYYYQHYRRFEPESEDELRMRNRRRYGSFPPPDPAERGLYPGLNIISPRVNIGRLSGDKGALGIEPYLAKELVHLFFNHQYLASLMFHRPTFMMALSKGQVPMPLLNSIFALAAPYSSQPSLRTHPSWHAGERFAQVANAELFDQTGQLALRPDLAVVQALCLLVLHECVMRRPTTNDRHMCIAFQIMKDLGVATMDDPANVALSSSSTPERDTFEQWVSAECHRRTFWVLYVLESLSSAFTSRPMTFKDSQLKVRLPVDEASFELGLRGESAPEYLQFPMPQAKPSSTGEFGHFVRVTWIYTTVMNQITELNKKGRPPGPGDSVTMDTINHSEQCLHSWETSLPERLRFNSETLHNQIKALENGGSTSGWTYAYMHALAECSILGLHELLEVMPNREAARAHAVRQQRALDNLTITLGSLGTRGRLSIWSGTLLLAVVRYRAMLSPQPDPHVTEWCAEFQQQWGVSLAELVNPEFRRVWCAPVKPKERDSTSPTPPPPSPHSRSPAGYPTTLIPASQVTLPPLQSFGLLHHPQGGIMHLPPQGGISHPSPQGNLHPLPGGGMHPPPSNGTGPPSVHPGPSPAHTPGPPGGGDSSMHTPSDRRIGGMPRGLPWLEDELKNGNGAVPADTKRGPR